MAILSFELNAIEGKDKPCDIVHNKIQHGDHNEENICRQFVLESD